METDERSQVLVVGYSGANNPGAEASLCSDIEDLPGGTVPLTEDDVGTMHPARLPENVYVADASLLPSALGNPPILTIVAMAKRVARSAPGSWGRPPDPRSRRHDFSLWRSGEA